MPKLTDSQSMVLSKAAAREDGVAVVPRGMNKAAAAKVGSNSSLANSCAKFGQSRGCRSGAKKMEGMSASSLRAPAVIGAENDTVESDRSAARKTGDAAARERGSIDGAPRPGSKQALTLIVAPAINAGVIGHVAPEGHSETGLCQISNRSAARRNGNWKMALRDRRHETRPSRTEMP